MKFGAALQRCSAQNDVIADVHATYKLSKKILNSGDPSCQFAALLAQKVADWSEHYIDAEDDLVIECSEFQKASNAHSSINSEAYYDILAALVDFHGRHVNSAHHHVSLVDSHCIHISNSR